MEWTPLDFGKQKGLTLPQIVLKDPDWFFWAISDDVFKSSSKFFKEAKIINEKARNIKIPNLDNEQLEVEYYFARINAILAYSHLLIVPQEKPEHKGSSYTVRSRFIDLSIPSLYNKYDKSGYKRFIKDVKNILFGSPSYKLTKTRCESFFDESSNFAL